MTTHSGMVCATYKNGDDWGIVWGDPTAERIAQVPLGQGMEVWKFIRLSLEYHGGILSGKDPDDFPMKFQWTQALNTQFKFERYQEILPKFSRMVLIKLAVWLKKTRTASLSAPRVILKITTGAPVHSPLRLKFKAQHLGIDRESQNHDRRWSTPMIFKKHWRWTSMTTNCRHLHITVTATDYWLGCKVLIHMSQGGLHEGSTVHGTAFQHGWKLWRFVLVEEFNIRVIREAERHEGISVISPWYSHSIPTYRYL